MRVWTNHTLNVNLINLVMKLNSILHTCVYLSVLAIAALPIINAEEIYQQGFLSKEEARKSIQVPEGYKLQLVLSDPIIQEPVAVAWDGNGTMYVVQMRTYMKDADASGENEPLSRISRHEDTNGDGVYDKHSVYINKIILPRMILPLDDRLMVGVSHTLDLWNYRDTNDDGIADEKIKIYEGGPRGGNIEHQPSGLIWAMDNWIYMTYENVRHRYTDGKLITQVLPRGNGQWGLTQDDDGRLYYSRAGAESPAESFQQAPQYGMINLQGQLEKGFKRVFPIATIPDVQGGSQRLGPSSGLNYFSGCAGQEIFRGNALPGDTYGDLFIPEPVGRLIRRAKVTRYNGQSTISNTTPDREFIRTKDVNFRPVQTVTGPDGCLYIVDMHRGIIQQGKWTKPNSYLRGVIDKWQLDKNINRGRIYRLVHKDHQPAPKPQLNTLPTKELLNYLHHSNGWHRDTAKRLIILREDRNSVVPLLDELCLNQKLNNQTRITALWTLEGISAVSPELLIKLLADPAPRIVCHTIRASEHSIKKNDTSLISAIKKHAHTSDPEIAIQLLNTIRYCGSPDSLDETNATLMSNHGRLPAVVANVAAVNKTKLTGDAKMLKAMKHGSQIYAQLCTECHGSNGQGTPMAGQPGVTLAPSLRSKRITGSGETLIRILLQGLQGPIDGKTYAAGIMPPQGSNNDQWIADVATYVRNSFNNKATMISSSMVKSIRKADSGRTKMWTQKELGNLTPQELKNQNLWKLTASHREADLKYAIDRNTKTRYSSKHKMKPGMWIQVELPSAVEIQRITMEFAKSQSDFPATYTIGFSMDGKHWETSPVQEGTSSATSFFTTPTKARFIRINQLGKSKKYYWSIHELHLFGQ